MKRILLLAVFCAMAFASCTKTVVKDPDPEVLASVITIDKDKLVVPLNEQMALHTIVVPENAGPIAWLSDNPSIASVSKEGVVKGITLGETDVFAVAGKFLATCHVTVVNPITSIALNKETLELVRTNTFQLTATIAPDDATEVIEWTSSNPDIASVDEDGLVTAVANGDATITAKAVHTEAKCEVKVVPLVVDRIELQPTSVSVNVGETQEIMATIIPAEADDQTIVWSIADEEIASVEDGLVTGLVPGYTYVRATAANGVYAEALVVVNGARPVPYFEDFEHLDALADWLVYDTDNDGDAWHYITTEDGAPTHSGEASLVSFSYYNNYGALTPDNWMISPPIKLDDDYNRLSFWACATSANYPLETYGAYVLVKDEQGEYDLNNAFELLKGTITQGYTTYEETPPEENPIYKPMATEWEHILVEIPAQFKGMEVAVAIRHFDCTDQYAIVVDDVEVTNVKEVPEPDPDPDPSPAPPRRLKGGRSNILNLHSFGRKIVK